MKRFNSSLFFFALFLFVFIESICRLLIDPVYFNEIDFYSIKPASVIERFMKTNTPHADYLFIGSSRVAASIDPNIFETQSPDYIIINAGRGYSTPAIHYQALKKKITEHPDFIKGAKVFIEYPGSKVYTENFLQNQLRVYEPDLPTDKPMPHLLLPYIDTNELKDFFRKSPNKTKVKIEMFFLYMFSSYHCMPFINEKLKKINNLTNKPESDDLKLEGGIRNDNMEWVRNNALKVAQKEIEAQSFQPSLTDESMEESFLAHFNTLISTNGGRLFLFRMPLHSVQKKVFSTDKELANQKVFEQWLNKNKVTVLNVSEFKYTDNDFPDTWHLASNRMRDFSLQLSAELETIK